MKSGAPLISIHLLFSVTTIEEESSEWILKRDGGNGYDESVNLWCGLEVHTTSSLEL
jgi:hypothetical protein